MNFLAIPPEYSKKLIFNLFIRNILIGEKNKSPTESLDENQVQ